MSKITSPILLDTTGKSINSTLRDISQLMAKADKAFIDDNVTCEDRIWSSSKMIDSFTTPASVEGASVSFIPVAGTPIMVETPVAGETTLTLTHESSSGEATQYITVIPCAGTYNWSTGEFVLPSGAVAQLNYHNIMSFKGTNTMSVSEGTLTAVYRTVLIGDGSPIIYGGSAQEV